MAKFLVGGAVVCAMAALLSAQEPIWNAGAIKDAIAPVWSAFSTAT